VARARAGSLGLRGAAGGHVGGQQHLEQPGQSSPALLGVGLHGGLVGNGAKGDGNGALALRFGSAYRTGHVAKIR